MNDELLVSFLLGEADEKTGELVAEWITRNDANRQYFDHFRLIWETSSTVTVPEHVNEQEAWQRFKQRTANADRKNPPVRLMQWLKVAAVLLIGAGLSYLFLNIGARDEVTVAAAATTKRDTLPDGSTITLNKQSNIIYNRRFRGDTRRVSLKGEAFFVVKPNKNKPFIIDAHETEIVVIGTSFNVKTSADSTQVIVESGKVKVKKGDNTVFLNRGEKVTIRRGAELMRKDTVEEKLYNHYHSREFVCDNTPLWKLVEALNGAYNSNIVIADPSIRNLPLTTTFSDTSLDNILDIVSQTLNVRVERKENITILQ